MKTPKLGPITDGIEAIHEISSPVSEVVKKETDAAIDSLWQQLLGVKQPDHTSGEMQQGQEISFAHAKKQEQPHQPKAEQPKNVNIAAAIDYRGEILHGESRISKETEQILSQQIEQISAELRQLVNASTELAITFKDVAVEQHITKPGKYHVNLFQFILAIVRQARQKVEHSGAWMSAAKGRKQKQDYWSLFEQQGTSFAQNNERAIATQAG